jgi:hypothetical protein
MRPVVALQSAQLVGTLEQSFPSITTFPAALESGGSVIGCGWSKIAKEAAGQRALTKSWPL